MHIYVVIHTGQTAVASFQLARLKSLCGLL